MVGYGLRGSHSWNKISLAIARYLSPRLPFYYGWVVVFAAGTTVFARMAPSVGVLSIFLSPMAEEFWWSRTLIAGAVSAGAIASIFVSPIVGWAVERYGARLILTVSMVVLGVAVTSLAWATVPVFFFLGFATGRVIFNVPVQIGSGAVVSRWFANSVSGVVRLSPLHQEHSDSASRPSGSGGVSLLLLPRCAHVDTIFPPVLALAAVQPGTAKHQRRRDYGLWTV